MFRSYNRTVLLFGLTSLTTLIVLYGILYPRNFKSKRKAKVIELWCYLVKGCAGIQLSSGQVTRRGFEFDRDFMFIDKNN
jgi:hypothetical protein